MARIRLLIAGISGQPETFLQRLIEGLAKTPDIEIMIASRQKPKMANHSNVHWIRTPAWDGPILIRIFRLLWMGLRGAFCSLSDTKRIFSKSRFRTWNSVRETLRTWNRLIPFAGKKFNLIYFPWNSSAINHLPLFDWGIPVVVSCRGAQINIAPHNPERYPIRSGLKITLKKASAIHCVSDAIKREAMKYGLDAKKAWVIRPAVDADFFYPSQRKNKEADKFFKIVSVGSLIWRKGYEYALVAIQYLIRYGIPVRYTIVGDGPEQQRVLYTIYDLNIQDHVQLVGQISPDLVREQLHQADVFLLSSLSEGISNAVLEAMACGLPVVTTDCGGMREAITDGVEGFIVPVRDPEAIAQALIKLWKNPDLRNQMGEAGRKRVLKEFTLEKQISEFLTLYYQVLKNRDNSSAKI